MDNRYPVKKETGVRHFFAAGSYSFNGAKRLLGEAAFRHELLFYVVVLIAFAFVGAAFVQYLVMTGLFLLMAAFEALNTAIEEVVDRVSPEFSEFGRNAKDLGSFAVLCLIAANGGYAFYVVVLERFL